MTAMEPGFAFVFAMAVLQGRPADTHERFAAEPAARHLLLADLTAVPEPKPADQKAPDPPAHPPPAPKSADAQPAHDPPPPKPAREAEPAKCYNALLDFSLGDSDKKTKEQIVNQDCK